LQVGTHGVAPKVVGKFAKVQAPNPELAGNNAAIAVNVLGTAHVCAVHVPVTATAPRATAVVGDQEHVADNVPV